MNAIYKNQKEKNIEILALHGGISHNCFPSFLNENIIVNLWFPCDPSQLSEISQYLKMFSVTTEFTETDISCAKLDILFRNGQLYLYCSSVFFNPHPRICFFFFIDFQEKGKVGGEREASM